MEDSGSIHGMDQRRRLSNRSVMTRFFASLRVTWVARNGLQVVLLSIKNLTKIEAESFKQTILFVISFY